MKIHARILLHWRRRWYLRKVTDADARVWLEAPLPAARQRLSALRLVVVDLEMTGLNERRDAIVSIGWVAVEQGVIELSSARYYRVRPTTGVGQSATIHQLRDIDLADAASLPAVLGQLLRDSAGALLVFHNAALDRAFLNRACRRYFNMPLLSPVVDTLAVERKRLVRRNQPVVAGALRLTACRARYNLPDYQAHNALIDALATAELLLAQVQKKSI